jgi:hypothetical protein
MDKGTNNPSPSVHPPVDSRQERPRTKKGHTMPAYQLEEVMLPRGRVYHLLLVDVHPDVWDHIRGRGWPAWRSTPVDDYPALLCHYALDRDALIPHTGSRRLCGECEWMSGALDGRVDELRWMTAEEIGRRDPDDITRAFLAKVGW